MGGGRELRFIGIKRDRIRVMFANATFNLTRIANIESRELVA